MAGQAHDGGASLHVAMLGQKGFPAVWGGIESHVTELAPRLAALGHEVTVFVRRGYQREVKAAGLAAPPGVRVRALPSLATKHLDALSHTALSTLCAGRAFDILHYHAVGPGSVIALARWTAPRTVTVLTVHALDWKRAKWAAWAKRLMRRGEALGVRRAGGVIAVSGELRDYLRQRYGVTAELIPNGVRPPRVLPPGPFSDALGISPRRYFLFVGRLVPEKGVHDALEAFRRLRTDWRFVVVGPAQEGAYARQLAETARRDERVILPGVVHGDRLWELYSNAGAVVLPSYLEGLSLSFLEGLSYGLPVVASDLEGVREVLARTRAERVFLFAPGDHEQLAARLRAALETPGRCAGAAPAPGPSWDDVALRVEAFYRRIRGR